ncbi:MAG TPA: TonB-dependent receptor [Anaeromyxobacter sp.]
MHAPLRPLAVALAVAALTSSRARATDEGGPQPAPTRPPPAAPAPARDEALPTLPGEGVVVGTRSLRPAGSLPTTVQVVRRDALDRSAAPTLDGALRMLPSFATFRRSTSLAADPSSQGLNLRGVAPSAIARTLLLDDGVPVDDPFFGFVPWRALPRLGLARVEVAPGGASALYGSQALGGVVALVPRPIAGRGLEAESWAGSFGTYGLAARAEHRSGPLAGALEAEHAGTNGYDVVAPWARGPVDGPAGARHATASARVALEPGDGLRLRLGAGYFDETQDGGTRYTGATARAATGRAGLEREGPRGRVVLLVYGGVRRFTQDRARIPAGRASEALTASQEVPSTDLGGSLLGALAPANGHALSAGVDLRRVAGESDETLYPSLVTTTSVVAREAAGTQWTGGAFVQDAWTPRPAIEVGGALRFDLWRTEDGRAARTLGDGSRVDDAFAPRTRALLSPRLAVRFSAARSVTLRASAYRAFRAPTLNELYRPFQVGTVLTDPNPALRPEVLSGAEAGVEIGPARAMRLRATAFWNALDDAIATVTLPAPLEDGATRRRENLGRAVIRGVETEAAWRPIAGLEATLAYTLADARVTSAPGRPELVGKALAQDPAHRVTASLGYDRPRAVAARLEVRFLSRAWEDDLNTLALPAFAVLDASLTRPLTRSVDAFVAADNLLDRRYLVGRAGVDTVGAPRLVRVGVRMRTGAGAGAR